MKNIFTVQHTQSEHHINGFVIRTAEKGSFLFSDTLKELFHFKWEFLMIHMAGFNQAPAFNTDYLLGPAWFISSLLLALIPFRFLLSSLFSLVRRRYEKE